MTTFQIVHKGVCVENQIPESMVQRALRWWSKFGMDGAYVALPEPRLPKTEITLARKTNSK
jgi:hypothetical protein